LLERILKVSSNEDSVVLDPFCGCGTAIAVAERLHRPWIGIDITHIAINLIRHRLYNAFGDRAIYKIIGEPTSLHDARALAQQDRYQFQSWALGLVRARSEVQKKGRDRGIDGRLFFHDEGPTGKTKEIIFSVKSGNTGPGDVRDLRGVVEREKSAIGVFITLQESTRDMRSEAATAGFYFSPGWNQQYPKLQILTVAELLNGSKIEYPPSRDVNVTFRRAPRVQSEGPENLSLL
jgi:site-specific DNA-methyltransferase (adenine-specific)